MLSNGSFKQERKLFLSTYNRNFDDEVYELTGIAHYAFVQYPDTAFVDSKPNPALGGSYKISLELSGDQLERANDLGFTHVLNTKDGKGQGDTGYPYTYLPISCREKFKDKTGTIKDRTKPQVVDDDNNPVMDNVGNGSKVTVKFRRYKGSNGRYYASLMKLKVHDLVKYEPKGNKRFGS